MTKQHRPGGKYGATPGKLILVSVLAVTLVAVVYWNYFRDGAPAEGTTHIAAAPAPEAADRKASAERRDRQAQSPSAPQNEAASGGKRERSAWPDFELARAAAYDPFAVPGLFPQPRTQFSSSAGGEATDASSETATEEVMNARAAALEAIRQKGVTLILRNGREYVAKIGELEIRVGDRIGGFRVVDISLRGVTLEGEALP
jgi:hypothetical protein